MLKNINGENKKIEPNLVQKRKENKGRLRKRSDNHISLTYISYVHVCMWIILYVRNIKYYDKHKSLAV